MSHAPRRLAAAAATLALAACSSAIDGGIAEPQIASGSTLVITATGAGGITAATPYSREAVEAALPGYAAAPVTLATENRTVEGLALFNDGLQILQVVPGDDGMVGEIHGVSASLRGPAGTRIGMSMAEAKLTPASCRAGSGNWADMPICAAPGAPNVLLVFAVPGYMADAGPADSAMLAGATLQRIIWTAGGTAS